MRTSIISAFFVLLASGTSSAQGIEYEITPLGLFPGTDITFGTGLNDRGEVVGWSVVYGPNLSIFAWHWSAEAGFVALPPTPGQPRGRAIDINNAGVIAGDGAYDSGFAWRYENGAYTLLGAFPGDGRSIAAGINEAGEITGTSFGFQLVIPKKAFLSVPGAPLQELVHGEGTAINELGQVAGWAGTFAPFRYTPGVGMELLPLLAGNSYHYTSGINNLGHVVGRATHANGNGGVPFLYTNSGGMQEISNFGGSAGAAAINDHGVVIGNYSPSGGGQPWIWTASEGLRFLSSLVDLSQGSNPYSALRVNNRGQLLLRAYSPTLQGFQPALLTPLEPSQPGFAFCLGTGCPCGDDRLAGCANSTGAGATLAGAGTTGVAADDLVLTATGLPASVFGLLYAGPDAMEAPFGDGKRCVGGGVIRFAIQQADSNGTLLEGPGIAGFVGAAAGDTLRFQAWYRDAAGCTSADFNLSNGYGVTFTP